MVPPARPGDGPGLHGVGVRSLAHPPGARSPAAAPSSGGQRDAERRSRAPPGPDRRRPAGRRGRRGAGRHRRPPHGGRQPGRTRLARRPAAPDVHRPGAARRHRPRRPLRGAGRDPDHRPGRRPLGLRPGRVRAGHGPRHRQGAGGQRGRDHGRAPGPRRPCRRLPLAGGPRRLDRDHVLRLGRTAKQVVPFGGREPRLGTNPLCIALPSDLEAPIFIDMATSAAAANKIAVYRNRGQRLPPGWIVDRDGNPSTDPDDFAAGGALLPVGGRPGPQGLRSGLHDRGLHRRPHRPGLRGRPFRAPQRRRVAAGAQPRRLPPRRNLPHRGRRVRSLRQGDAPGARLRGGPLSGRAGVAHRAGAPPRGIPVDEATWSAVLSTADSLGLGDRARATGRAAG